MRRRSSLVLCMAALVMLFTVAGNLAAQVPGVCTSSATVNNVANTTPLNIAVAANFFTSSVDMATNFTSTAPGNTYTVNICSNSTGNLEGQINKAPGLFDIIFAADTMANWSPRPAGTPSPYAIGIPTIATLKTLTGLNGNVQNLVPGANTSAPNSLLAGELSTQAVPFNTVGSIAYPSSSSIAIANPAVAPFGVAAQLILGDMQSAAPTQLFPNVELAYDAVFSSVSPNPTNPSGFVAKSQVCANTNAAYVAFTYSTYLRSQYYLKLTSAADDLVSYINGQMTTAGATYDTAWDDFLVAHFYNPLN